MVTLSVVKKDLEYYELNISIALLMKRARKFSDPARRARNLFTLDHRQNLSIAFLKERQL
jgi:hypothetical protein